MRLLLSFVFCFFLSLSVTAQSKETVREIGLRSTGLDQFSLLYKKGLTKDRFLRVRFLFANLQLVSVGNGGVGNFGLGAAVGWERRRSLSDRLDLLTGPEPFASFGITSVSDNSSVVNIRLGLGYVVGFQYALSDRFHVALEVIPSVSFGLTGTGEESGDVASFQAGLSNNSVAVTGVYRFVK